MCLHGRGSSLTPNCCLVCLPAQSELKTSKNKSKKAAEAEAKAEEEAATKSGGCSNKTVKFDNLINPKTLKAFDKKNVSRVVAHGCTVRARQREAS